MSGGHTPGPWTFGPSAVILGSNGKRVCQLAVRLDAADLADANLVAAAPDLLEVLYQYESDLRYPPSGDSVERRIARVRAAIAKARGEA